MDAAQGYAQPGSQRMQSSAGDGYVYDPDRSRQPRQEVAIHGYSEWPRLSLNLTVKPEDPGFAGGDGSEENPFLIMNAEQFNEIRNYSDKHFVLGADIALGEYVPTPSFSGSLNGEYQGVKYTCELYHQWRATTWACLGQTRVR